MAAATDVLSFHGVTASAYSVKGTNARHKRDDNDTADLEQPIMVPTELDPAGTTNYGWRKHTKINFTSTPTAQISNLVWYLDLLPEDTDPARNWDGVSFYAGLKVSYTGGSASDEAGMVSGLADADLIPYDAMTPMVVTSGVVLSNPSTGYGTQDYVVVQMSVNGLALPGEKDPRQSYYRWDEI